MTRNHVLERTDANSRIFRAQIHTLYRTLPASVTGSLLMVFVWVATISRWLPIGAALCWGAAMLVQFLFWIDGARRYHARLEQGKISDESLHGWARRAQLVGFSSGCLWGASSLFFFPSPGAVHADYQYLLMLTLAGLIAGSALAHGAYLPATWSFIFPASVPIILKLLTQAIFIQAMFGLSAVFFVSVIVWFARIFNATLLDAFRIRFENESLVDQMTEQHLIVLEVNNAKNKFLASASHDLRQPLHAITLFLEALRHTNLPQTQHQIIEKIEHSTAAMGKLLDTLLDISKLDAGVIKPVFTTVSLADLIGQLADEFRGPAEKKGLSLDLRVPPHATSQTDPVLLKSVLGNLLSNAVHYTQQGRVLITCRPDGDNWHVDVIDTGLGIPLAQQSEIFKEFVQLNQPLNDQRQGLGLGLAIVERLIRLLDHELKLHSIPNRGSRFRVTVPKATNSCRTVDSLQAFGTSPFKTDGLVLVIDDEMAVREAMRAMLSSWGFRSVCVPDAHSAMLALIDESVLPMLIISDYQLGQQLNGIETIAYIRSEFNVGEEIAALLVTADIASSALLAVRDSGIPTMHKPIDTADLRRFIQGLAQESVTLRH